MKNLFLVLSILAASVSFSSSHANWFGSGNNGEWKMGPNGAYWDESDWPEWTPMYWMEEFMDSWDNNGWGGNSWGNNNYGNYGYGSPYYGGYNQNPYGYNTPFYGGYAYPIYPTIPAAPAPQAVK